MIYIVCTSGFHRALAGEISKKQSKPCTIVSLDKSFSWGGKFFNICKAIPLLIRCGLDRDSYAIVPHPFNPWFSLFVFFSKGCSIFDDGIAYYYDAKIPDNLFCRIYLLIAYRINREVSPDHIGKVTFLEYLKSSTVDFYYSVYPNMSSVESSKVVAVRPEQAGRCEGEGINIFLDTHSQVAAHVSELDIVEYFNARYLEDEFETLYYKPHPRSPSKISQLLSTQSWAQEINEDYEVLIGSSRVSRLYSIYSSAALITKIMQPESSVYCFTNDSLIGSVGRLQVLFECENVEFIRVA